MPATSPMRSAATGPSRPVRQSRHTRLPRLNRHCCYSAQRPLEAGRTGALTSSPCGWAWPLPFRCLAGGSLRIDRGLESRASDELRQLDGLDLDRFAGGRVAAVARGARDLFEREPKPGRVTTPPFLTVVTMASSRVASTRLDSAFDRPCWPAISSVSSIRFMYSVSRSRPSSARCGLCGRWVCKCAQIVPADESVRPAPEAPSLAPARRNRWRSSRCRR